MTLFFQRKQISEEKLFRQPSEEVHDQAYNVSQQLSVILWTLFVEFPSQRNVDASSSFSKRRKTSKVEQKTRSYVPKLVKMLKTIVGYVRIVANKRRIKELKRSFIEMDGRCGQGRM
ncbi:hypothetical protein YC2023_110133 [Brassica napus]